jgi:hypothetical protein
MHLVAFHSALVYSPYKWYVLFRWECIAGSALLFSESRA